MPPSPELAAAPGAQGGWTRLPGHPVSSTSSKCPRETWRPHGASLLWGQATLGWGWRQAWALRGVESGLGALRVPGAPSPALRLGSCLSGTVPGAELPRLLDRGPRRSRQVWASRAHHRAGTRWCCRCPTSPRGPRPAWPGAGLDSAEGGVPATVPLHALLKGAGTWATALRPWDAERPRPLPPAEGQARQGGRWRRHHASLQSGHRQPAITTALSPFGNKDLRASRGGSGL